MSNTTLKINFSNIDAARHFASWLVRSGQQDYWLWMECREEEEPGPITVIEFFYRLNKDFPTDFTIETECGRMSEEEEV